MAEKCASRKTSIGGQAVLEGVMMKGPGNIAVAVRVKEDTIEIKNEKIEKNTKYELMRKIPVLRGVIAFFQSMVMGVKTIMTSADMLGIDDDEAPSKFDKLMEKWFGDKLKDVAIYGAVILSIIMSVGLFILLPTVLSGFTKQLLVSIPSFHNAGELAGFGIILANLIEGAMRILIFLTYIILISQMKDMKRVFEYHGAEHKSIACYESGEALTIENVKKYPRFHKRCGTSFLLIVMIVSIILFSFFSWSNVFLRMFYRILLLPVVAGISYEFVKIAGASDNPIISALTKPGLWLQRFTTREPDDSQIEVALASLNAVIPENFEEAQW